MRETNEIERVESVNGRTYGEINSKFNKKINKIKKNKFDR